MLMNELRQKDEVSTLNSVFVLAGDLKVATESTRFVTVLGSCVSACIFDEVNRIGGINHVQMPGLSNSQDDNPNRWGESSTRNLILGLIKSGADRRYLKAKVFGGGNINSSNVPSHLRIGDKNVQSVLETLRNESIPVIKSSVRGSSGRKIIFDSGTGSVWVKTLSKN